MSRLPTGMNLDIGAILEPLGVAMHAHTRANLPSKSTILVLGAGAVGLLVAAVAKAYGAEKVIIADVQSRRIDHAVQHKFADVNVLVPMERPQTIDDKLEYAKKVAELVGKASGDDGQVDAVFECTGVETCLQTAIYVSARLSHVSNGMIFLTHRKTAIDRHVLGYQTRRKGYDHWHGHTYRHFTYISRGSSRSRSRRRLQIREHLPQGH